jgi:hypothetical protein
MTKDLGQPKQGFTGYWIPRELTEKLKLSFIEASLLSMIDSLDNCEKRCHASNAYLAKLMGLSVSRISFYITKLKRLDLIEEISFTGRRRILGVLKHNWFPHPSSKKESCVKSRSLHTRKHVGSSIYKNEKDELLLQEEASPQEVVFPCLDQLKLSTSKKKQLSKKHSEKTLIDAVKKTLAWKGKRSHEAAIETILSRGKDWNNVESKEDITEKNIRFKREFMIQNDQVKFGNYRCDVLSKSIEFISNSQCAPTSFSIDDKDMIDKVSEFVKKNPRKGTEWPK